MNDRLKQQSAHHTPSGFEAQPYLSCAVDEKIVVRLPAGLRRQLKLLSERRQRSMNAEVVTVLQEHIRLRTTEQRIAAHEADGRETATLKQEALHQLLKRLPTEKQEALLALLLD
ncbi:MAG: Arc family DNA-binding protein [Pseudomonadales bacterium]|jgi:plasmid stability protein|nr:Arc family DNA-binding protein [Pseudomonadales bacterium]